MDPIIRDKLVSALTQYDMKQAKKKYHNIYALGLYFKALDNVETAVDNGTSIHRALYDNFSDRLLSALERKLGLPLTYGGGGQSTGRPK
jgi:hypothetical protein